MQDLNKVFLIGRLTRDMELNYTSGGTACGKLGLAVNESRKTSDGQRTDYANYLEVTIWGKSAEALKPYLLKGKPVAIDGHLHQDRWEKEGKKNSKIVIIADNIQLLGSGRENREQAQQDGGYYQQQPAEAYTPEYRQQELGEEEFSEDIPF